MFAAAGRTYEEIDRYRNSAKRFQDSITLRTATTIYGMALFFRIRPLLSARFVGSLALTALLASFMSCAWPGNVTAFNTVWTYDIYQAYIAPNRSDQHYMAMGRWVTFVRHSVDESGAAYVASQYNNAMDIIQLVFGFVECTVVCDVFLSWECSGSANYQQRSVFRAAWWYLHVGLVISRDDLLVEGNPPGIKGGYIHRVFDKIPQRNGPELLAG